jgi:diketogulonate reductase-like aldo/keto reductase
MPFSRRSVLKLGVGAGASLALGRIPLFAQTQTGLIRKAIPSSGEMMPVIGLGSSGTFDLLPQSPDWAPARQVLKLFKDAGGKFVDTAPSYRRSEQFIGSTIQDLGLSDALFLATKVNVENEGKAAAAAQMENSLRLFGRKTVDLMQVWNLGGSIRQLSAATLMQHLEIVNEWKAAGRVRYTGITTSRDPQYADVEAAMKAHKFDFVQLDYSIGDRIPEQRLLPLAKERGIAVVVNQPFAAGRLFPQVAGKPLPAFASEIGVTTWAQYFLKFVVSHPSVTVVIPATNDPKHLVDNMGAGVGRLPDEAMRKRMVEAFERL